MSLLFESFVRNLYKRELHKVKVYRENINWRLDGLAKYYREAVKSYRGGEKLRTANLYQLFSY
ncbi:hypothetical protein [Clostridium tagluense]|uniref:hypothetical protein n=1 Tax=Clostridium tagluense TaxID=360422 RepID=UPI001C0E24C5|nr:hypothetical protein [Clostridium tagluense]MBU3130634.1 hypothetical protein [Clostridium tagluense]